MNAAEPLLPQTKEELDEHRAKAQAAKEALERRIAQRVELTRSRAINAAKRLLAHRPALMPYPKTELELVDMIDHMAKNARRYGVKLMAWERKALDEYHMLWRAQQKVKQDELAKTAPEAAL